MWVELSYLRHVISDLGRIATKLKREFQSALGNKVVSLTGTLEGQRMAEAAPVLPSVALATTSKAD